MTSATHVRQYVVRLPGEPPAQAISRLGYAVLCYLRSEPSLRDIEVILATGGRRGEITSYELDPVTPEAGDDGMRADVTNIVRTIAGNVVTCVADRYAPSGRVFVNIDAFLGHVREKHHPAFTPELEWIGSGWFDSWGLVLLPTFPDVRRTPRCAYTPTSGNVNPERF